MKPLRTPHWHLAILSVCVTFTTLVVAGNVRAQGPPRRPDETPRQLATNQRHFKIPYHIGPKDDHVVQVILQHSIDLGQTWRIYQRQSATQRGFDFRCDRDGEYWFMLQTVDRHGVVRPLGKPRPELTIIVDTTKPEFDFQVRPDAAGRIVGQWTASDPALDINSLSIQYQANSASSPNQWIQVPMGALHSSNETVFQDQLAWWPQTRSRDLAVRAEIRDRAGNASVVTRKLEMPLMAQGSNLPESASVALAASNRSHTTTMHGYQRSGVPAALAQLIGNSSSPPAPLFQQDSSVQSAKHQSPATSAFHEAASDNDRSGDIVRPPAKRAEADQATRWKPRTVVAKTDQVMATGSTTRTASLSNQETLSSDSNTEDQQTQLATNTAQETSESSNEPRIPGSVLTNAKLEDLKSMARPSNSNRFQLDYEIDAVGPEGVKTVELWMTRDGGRNWRRTDTDDDCRSPINVQVDSEGIYGFRIAVISNDGLRTKPPRRDDAADLWVHVDLTKPTARITGAPFGSGPQTGKLLIQWTASDANMADQPIKLQYSSSPQGPWSLIENGLPNNGEHAWKPGPDVPDQIFLRLEARDQAGNVQSHDLQRPVDISGLIPRGHIRGVKPLAPIDT